MCTDKLLSERRNVQKVVQHIISVFTQVFVQTHQHMPLSS